ncbi:MAG: trypsin-like peptidase domain-containing protein [Mailhella sp.]|nr:trypsin-like peptidase domain-containing protein [Mailhella sp.]
MMRIAAFRICRASVWLSLFLALSFAAGLSGCLLGGGKVKGDQCASFYQGEQKDEIARRIREYGVAQPASAELRKFSSEAELATSMFIEGYYPVGRSEFVSVPYAHEADLKKCAAELGATRIHLSVKHHGVQYPGGDVFKHVAVFGVKCDERRHAGLLTQPAPEYMKTALDASDARQVLAVMKKSPAFYAHILEGDILLSVNGRKGTSGKDFKTGGNSVTIWRKGHILEKKLALGKGDALENSQAVLAENIRKDGAIVSRPGKKIEVPQASKPALAVPDMGALRQSGSGTGFYFTDDGYLATNHHVIEGGKRFLTVDTRTGERYEAFFVAQDAEGDIAILRVKGKKSHPIPLARYFNLKRGEDIMTLGYPEPSMQGIQQKATFGRVNATTGEKDFSGEVQIDIPLQPGNSGGPVINSYGQTVGIATSGFIGSQNVNYARKVDLLHTLIRTVPGLKPAASSGAQKFSFAELAEKFESSVVLILVYR